MEHKNWMGFQGGAWQNEINVRDFIQTNYKEYKGDSSFLAGATERTSGMMKKLNTLFTLERQYGGVLDIDTTTVSSLTAYAYDERILNLLSASNSFLDFGFNRNGAFLSTLSPPGRIPFFDNPLSTEANIVL